MVARLSVGELGGVDLAKAEDSVRPAEGRRRRVVFDGLQHRGLLRLRLRHLQLLPICNMASSKTAAMLPVAPDWIVWPPLSILVQPAVALCRPALLTDLAGELAAGTILVWLKHT